MKELTSVEELELLKKEPFVILFFTSTWCKACKTTESALASIPEVIKIDVEQFPNIAAKYLVRCLPTLIYLSNGEVSTVLTGATSPTIINSKLNEVSSRSKTTRKLPF